MVDMEAPIWRLQNHMSLTQGEVSAKYAVAAYSPTTLVPTAAAMCAAPVSALTTSSDCARSRAISEIEVFPAKFGKGSGLHRRPRIAIGWRPYQDRSETKRGQSFG
jgi:hypothetical protein